MRTWAFTLCYNEAVLIRFWVRWYATFCERVIVYVDDATDDDTENIARAEGADVRVYSGSGSLDDFAFVRFAEQRYKEARGRADWVIWADADEILYHPHIVERLDQLRKQGVTYPGVVGYDMFGEQPPCEQPPHEQDQIIDQIRQGIVSTAYTKQCIFDPALDIRWSPGKHNALASGNVVSDTSSADAQLSDPLKLLHYRWLGEQWFLERNARNFTRLNAENRAAQHGVETWPGYAGLYSHQWYLDHSKLAKDCL